MGIYDLQDHYSLSSWYENNGAYDLNAGTDMLLDLPRHILESDAYIYQGIAFPKGPDIVLAPQQTYSASLNLIPYSYLVSIDGWTGNGNQFTVRIFDKNAQTDLYFGQFGWLPTVISNMMGVNNQNMGQTIFQYTLDQPFGPTLLRDPLIILPPGVLQVQITNVSTNQYFGQQGLMQILFGFAVPKSTVSLNNRKVKTATDQSGLPSLLAALEG